MSTDNRIICDYPAGLTVIRLDECDSTNSYIKSREKEFKDDLPVLVTAEQQTGGRGRQDRQWLSPKGKGLYSSFAFSLKEKSGLQLLSLVAAVSVIDTLKDVTGAEFGLKWPNDILYRDKKVAGVLIENIIAQEDIFCITGMGINLDQDVADFPGELLEKAISLKMVTGLSYTAKEVNPCLATVFFNWLEKLKHGRGDKIVSAANQYSEFMMYRDISFHESMFVIEGIFKGINPDGGLKLGRPNGTTTIHYSGEIE